MDPARFVSVVPKTRPASLIPLYVSFAGVQALDIHSTYSGLERGGREANPLLGPVVGSPAAFVAVKAGATAGTIYLAEIDLEAQPQGGDHHDDWRQRRVRDDRLTQLLGRAAERKMRGCPRAMPTGRS